MKYSIVTFGCRVNQADSIGFEEGLMAAGASAAPPEQADIVVVNTCSVTASADQGARQTIRRIARANPAARIVVTGCYATRRPDEIRQLPGVACVVPNDDKPRLSTLLNGISLSRGIRLQPDPNPVDRELLRPSRDASADRRRLGVASQPDATTQTTAVRFGDGDGSCGAAIEPGTAGRTAFTLRVQTGCAETCAYCIIPTTRGRPRSVTIDEVLEQVGRARAAGFKEVALTGVHLGSYGRDLEPPSSLYQLLTALAGRRVGLQPDSGDRSVRLQPDLRYRISSLEPMDCTPEIVALVAEHDCFAPHFHLPLQHASNRMLAAMRRPYSIEQYGALVDLIRSEIPHAAIGSDVIVGFPGETEEDFEELAAYLESSPVTHVHVFPYSDRPGTVATGMTGKVPGAIIRERARRTRQIAEGLSLRFRDTQVGTVHPALTLEDGSLVVTGNYLKLRIPAGLARNEWVRVRVTGTGSMMTGEIG
jgi:threonylcarbamoyladenosine tRNA methylthiotransferase MtaB